MWDPALSMRSDPGRGARVSSLPDYSTPARRSRRSREFPWNLTCYWCERFQVDPRDIAVILVVPETSDISRSKIMSYLFIEHITKGRELNLFINNIELMIREVPPYLVAWFTIWRKIPRDIESAPYVCVDNGKSYWRLRRHRRRRTLSYCGAADYDGEGGCFVCCIRSAWWQLMALTHSHSVLMYIVWLFAIDSHGTWVNIQHQYRVTVPWHCSAPGHLGPPCWSI